MGTTLKLEAKIVSTLSYQSTSLLHATK